MELLGAGGSRAHTEDRSLIRLAAVGDIHFSTDSRGILQPHLDRLAGSVDLLLLAGDLTRGGDRAEAAVLADELATVHIPKVAVLGNHDYHLNQEKEIADLLECRGVHVLEGETVTIEVDGLRIGVAGVKGFGGGFAGACATEFGEPEMKAFVAHSRVAAQGFEQALKSLETDVRIALMHYSPIQATLEGERLEIYPFLGSYLFGEAIDGAGADVVFHGHAHAGSEKGVTPGGVHVRNVSQPLIMRAYNTYCLGVSDGMDCEVFPLEK